MLNELIKYYGDRLVAFEIIIQRKNHVKNIILSVLNINILGFEI